MIHPRGPYTPTKGHRCPYTPTKCQGRTRSTQNRLVEFVKHQGHKTDLEITENSCHAQVLIHNICTLRQYPDFTSAARYSVINLPYSPTNSPQLLAPVLIPLIACALAGRKSQQKSS